MLEPNCEISVRVTPRSSQNKIEIVDEKIKIWVTASPTDGQANDAVCSTLAKALRKSNSAVSVRRGHTSRDKVLAITGITLSEAMALLTR